MATRRVTQNDEEERVALAAGDARGLGFQSRHGEFVLRLRVHSLLHKEELRVRERSFFLSSSFPFSLSLGFFFFFLTLSLSLLGALLCVCGWREV